VNGLYVDGYRHSSILKDRDRVPVISGTEAEAAFEI
jgi:hypothetical protein